VLDNIWLFLSFTLDFVVGQLCNAEPIKYVLMNQSGITILNRRIKKVFNFVRKSSDNLWLKTFSAIECLKLTHLEEQQLNLTYSHKSSLIRNDTSYTYPYWVELIFFVQTSTWSVYVSFPCLPPLGKLVYLVHLA